MGTKTEIQTVVVRPYRDEEDREQVIDIYQSSFAEPPWNEYMKCSSCGIEYGEAEVQTLIEKEDARCKKCCEPLKLEEFWSRENVKEELEFALSSQDSIVLVAEDKDGIAGILWGYKVSFGKCPFLEGKVREDANYWDTVTVKKGRRGMGVATLLGESYLERAKRLGVSQVVGRIREEVEQTHLLVKKFGFSVIPEQRDPSKRIYDPNYHNNLYLTKCL